MASNFHSGATQMSHAQCPFCNHIMANERPGSVIACPACGQNVQMPKNDQHAPAASPAPKRHRERTQAIPKNPGAAAVLSFLIPGMGQMLNGEVGKGLLVFFLLPVLMGVSVVAYVTMSARVPQFVFTIPLLPIGWFCLWVFQIFDAYNSAVRHNRRNGFR